MTAASNVSGNFSAEVGSSGRGGTDALSTESPDKKSAVGAQSTSQDTSELVKNGAEGTLATVPQSPGEDRESAVGAQSNAQDIGAAGANNNLTDTFRRGPGELSFSGAATGRLEGPGGLAITDAAGIDTAMQEAIRKALTTPNQPSTLGGATNGFVARAEAKGVVVGG
jgi:hypothetical protein